ncbi:MAG: hypothetical protein HHJ13_00045 [Phycicoccus sp.]|nr:hypothetical protein [Phycicoccus sp.]
MTANMSGGGWVLHNPRGAAPYDDILKAPKDAGVIFSAQASLYNDYAYFWRWAFWKVFEQDPSKSGVVSFITASSWLSGPAFLGLRRLAREHADEMWVIDLGGEGRGARTEQNVFAIQTPVAIVTLYRNGKGKKGYCPVRYRRITGTTAEKFAALHKVDPPTNAADDPWTTVSVDAGGTLIPEAGGADWTSMPALTDVFPYQQPGVMANRSWPIGPSEAVLAKRWDALIEATGGDERAKRFVTPTTGRNIHTSVRGLPTLSTLLPGAQHQPIVRFGFRPFDRQWIINDPRLLALERPRLWESQSDKQVYLTTFTMSAIGEGPALTVTAYVCRRRVNTDPLVPSER